MNDWSRLLMSSQWSFLVHEVWYLQANWKTQNQMCCNSENRCVDDEIRRSQNGALRHTSRYVSSWRNWSTKTHELRASFEVWCHPSQNYVPPHWSCDLVCRVVSCGQQDRTQRWDQGIRSTATRPRSAAAKVSDHTRKTAVSVDRCLRGRLFVWQQVDRWNEQLMKKLDMGR